MREEERFQTEIKKEVARIQKAKSEEGTLFAQTVYLGTIGIMMVVPIVVGAYLGNYLDRKVTTFSVSWTVSLIVGGVFVGASNVYFFLKLHEE